MASRPGESRGLEVGVTSRNAGDHLGLHCALSPFGSLGSPVEPLPSPKLHWKRVYGTPSVGNSHSTLEGKPNDSVLWSASRTKSQP